MATVSKWTPFGVALDITATGSSVTRTSATQFTVKINASWETYYDGAQTKYGMVASSGNNSVTLKTFSNTAASSGSGSFVGTYSISGNGSATKTITVTFRNFNNDNGDSATKNVSFNVTVPAWTSYKIQFNANGGSGGPTAQTKWKDQNLTLSSVKPTRTGHSFKGWATSSTSTTVAYNPGGTYSANAAATLYAVWSANTYTVSYNANGGTGAPAAQTKTYGKALALSRVKPTRDNYTFKGWSTSASASTVSYAGGDIYTSNSAITLYAVWELAYNKPTIKYMTVTRCDSNKVESDLGKNALVRFAWTTTYADPTIRIEWESASSSGSKDISATGTSGVVDEVVGNDTISEESTYSIRATVQDSADKDPVYETKTLPGLVLPFDAKVGGKGVAFGKAADEEGFADFAFATRHRQKMVFNNNTAIYGTTPSGELKEAFNVVNATQGDDMDGNVVLGYGNYDGKNGRTNIYGHDVLIGVSNVASPGTFRPYYRRGDEISIDIKTAGFVTSGKTQVSFAVPMHRPIVGSPTVSAVSNKGFILRQHDSYTHGSTYTGDSANPYTYAIPTSYKVEKYGSGIVVTATFSTTTNATNNDSIGIYWSGYIVLS